MSAMVPTQDASSLFCGASGLPESPSPPSTSSLRNCPRAAAHSGGQPAAFQPRHNTIATLVAGVEEDRSVGFLPFCVRRLRGPGRVRRVPPGTAYHSAGALLRRLLRYSDDGQARVEVVRESAGSVSLGTGHLGGRQATAAEERREEKQQKIAVTQHAQLSVQETKSNRTGSQDRRERAAILAMETERRCKAEQEFRLSSLLQALPLLRVVPPQSLLQQAYTEELVAEPASHALTLPHTSRALNASISISSAAVMTHGDHLPSGVANSKGSDADGNGRSAGGNIGRHGAVMAADSCIRGASGLGLGLAVLLTPEEAAGLRETPLRRTPAQPTSASGSGGGGFDNGETHLSPLVPLSTNNIAAASSISRAPLSTLRETTGSTGATATSSSAGFAAEKLPMTLEEDSESAQAAAAAAAALNGIVIDSGFGVTIKVGASCDEPNSLRCVAWGGCRPPLLRAVVWRLLSDYAPAAVPRQKEELQRKRRQYESYTRQYCSALTMLSLRESPSTLPWTSPLPRMHEGSSAAGVAGLRDAPPLSRLPGAGLPQSNGLGQTLSGGASTTSAVAVFSPYERAILYQMLLDLPRHQSPIFHAGRSLAGMARCLFLWSQRHPVVGYVQGMDDVVAVFYQVFLADALRQFARGSEQPTTQTREGEPRKSGTAAAVRFDSKSDDKGAWPSGTEMGSMVCDTDTGAVMRLLVSSLSATGQRTSRPFTAASTPAEVAAPPIATTALSAPATRAASAAALSPYLSEADVDILFDTPAALDAMLAELPESYLMQVEGDTYWCAGRVLSLLQDNFMPGQPGILRNVRRLEALVRAVDPSLTAFLDGYGLTVMDGCFQWLHCLLARELPLPLLLRLWDCYLAIGIDGDRAPTMAATVSGAHVATSLPAAGMAAQESWASDEEIMHFHVCVCCALLRNLRTSLLRTASHTSTSTASLVPGGRWGAAALATVLPVFGSRTPQREGNGASASSAADVGVRLGTSLTAAPPMDVVMNTLKHPFEALFPQYTSAKQQQRSVDRENRDAQSSLQARASSTEAATRWLDTLIADAYCIWRQHPMRG
nr:unnamed protein product [Leishmania braziliensis]